MITRLRVDARLFNSSAHRRPGIIGRPLVVGKRQATLAKHLADPKTRWHCLQVTGWYGRNERLVEIVFGTALWHHPGSLVPIRYVLVRDVASKRHPHRNPQDLQVVDILRWSVRRWWIGVTFAEVRCHLGAETRRQWSDPAIARTTPALLGLFSLITLRAHNLYVRGTSAPRTESWYSKPLPTFSDALARVRRELRTHQIFTRPRLRQTSSNCPAPPSTP